MAQSCEMPKAISPVNCTSGAKTWQGYEWCSNWMEVQAACMADECANG